MSLIATELKIIKIKIMFLNYIVSKRSLGSSQEGLKEMVLLGKEGDHRQSLHSFGEGVQGQMQITHQDRTEKELRPGQGLPAEAVDHI